MITRENHKDVIVKALESEKARALRVESQQDLLDLRLGLLNLVTEIDTAIYDWHKVGAAAAGTK